MGVAMSECQAQLWELKSGDQSSMELKIFFMNLGWELKHHVVIVVVDQQLTPWATPQGLGIQCTCQHYPL